MVRLPAALLLGALTFLGSALLTMHLAGECVPGGKWLLRRAAPSCAYVPAHASQDAEPEPRTAAAAKPSTPAVPTTFPEARVRPSVVAPPPAPPPAVIGLRTAVRAAGADRGSPVETEVPDPPRAPAADSDRAPPVARGLLTTTVPVPRDPDALRRLLDDLDPRDLPAERARATVVLGLVIDVRGRVRDAEIVSSSGSDSVDEAVRRVAHRIRFTPAVQRGRSAPTRILFPVVLGRGGPAAARALEDTAHSP